MSGLAYELGDYVDVPAGPASQIENGHAVQKRGYGGSASVEPVQYLIVYEGHGGLHLIADLSGTATCVGLQVLVSLKLLSVIFADALFDPVAVRLELIIHG